jgi:ribosome-binding factor A
MLRHERLEEDFKMALSHIISYEIKNPNVAGLISVTGVQITPDQKYAKVHISVFNNDKPDTVITSLQKSEGYIKNELSKKVKMRLIPQITFKLDTSMEYGAHMDKLINDLKNGNK